MLALGFGLVVGGAALCVLRSLGAADALVIARLGVLPLAKAEPVVEHGLAVERQLHLAIDAADRPQQDMVRVVVGGRTAVRMGALVLEVPRPDQQHVTDDDPAVGRTPARLEDIRPGQVTARGRDCHVRGTEAEAARVAIQDRAEHAGRVHPRQAHPLDIAAWCDQRSHVAIRQEAVIRDRREGRRSPAGARETLSVDATESRRGSVGMHRMPPVRAASLAPVSKSCQSTRSPIGGPRRRLTIRAGASLPGSGSPTIPRSRPQPRGSVRRWPRSQRPRTPRSPRLAPTRCCR